MRPAIRAPHPSAHMTISPASMRRCQSARSARWSTPYPRWVLVPRRASYCRACRVQYRSPLVRIVGHALERPSTSSLPGHLRPAMPTPKGLRDPAPCTDSPASHQWCALGPGTPGRVSVVVASGPGEPTEREKWQHLALPAPLATGRRTPPGTTKAPGSRLGACRRVHLSLHRVTH